MFEQIDGLVAGIVFAITIFGGVVWARHSKERVDGASALIFLLCAFMCSVLWFIVIPALFLLFGIFIPALHLLNLGK